MAGGAGLEAVARRPGGGRPPTSSSAAALAAAGWHEFNDRQAGERGLDLRRRGPRARRRSGDSGANCYMLLYQRVASAAFGAPLPVPARLLALAAAEEAEAAQLRGWREAATSIVDLRSSRRRTSVPPPRRRSLYAPTRPAADLGSRAAVRSARPPADGGAVVLRAALARAVAFCGQPLMEADLAEGTLRSLEPRRAPRCWWSGGGGRAAAARHRRPVRGRGALAEPLRGRGRGRGDGGRVRRRRPADAGGLRAALDRVFGALPPLQRLVRHAGSSFELLELTTPSARWRRFASRRTTAPRGRRRRRRAERAPRDARSGASPPRDLSERAGAGVRRRRRRRRRRRCRGAPAMRRRPRDRCLPWSRRGDARWYGRRNIRLRRAARGRAPQGR